MFFATEKEAKEEIEKRVALRKKQGDDAVSISAGLREEALRCHTKLEPLGATLTQAVEYYIRHALPPGGRKNFRQITEIFMKDRIAKGCRAMTLKSYRSHNKVLVEEWGDVNIHQIQQEEIEEWLTELPVAPRTRCNYLMTLSTIFNFALKRKYCAENPATNISRPILDDKPVGILTIDQAQAVLEGSKIYVPELTPGLSIGMFAGLRTSELCALDWSEVNLTDRLIEVKATKAKTRQRRLVTISENLSLWLAPYVQERGPVLCHADEETGEREALGVNRYGKALRWLVSGGWDGQEEERKDHPPIVWPWPHNALRHSFGSYYFGRTKNENHTASEMGNSPAMVYKHYREVVRPAEVEKYWKIVPASEAANVLPMVAA